MANRNVLAGAGGLTQGLFRGLTTGIGLQQRQQALDREKLESELGIFNVIAKLPDGPFKKASMGRFLPRIGFSQESTDLLLKANEEDQEYLNKSLRNIMEQLPEGMGFEGFKELVGRMSPEHILKLVDVGLQIEGMKGQKAIQQAVQGALGGQTEGEGQPSMGGAASGAANALAVNLRAQRNQLTALMASPGIGPAQKEAIKTRITTINRDIERMEGMSPKQFEQQLQLSRERGAAAVAQQPIPTETAKQLSDLGVVIGLIDDSDRLFKPEYVGPIKGRARGAIEATTGKLSDEEIEFRAAVFDMQEMLLRARSGAQINEAEYQRLRKLVPNLNNPPNVFVARRNRFKRAIQTLIDEKRKMAGTTRGEVESESPKGDPLGGWGLGR